jgi:hypothetical protein
MEWLRAKIRTNTNTIYNVCRDGIIHFLAIVGLLHVLDLLDMLEIFLGGSITLLVFYYSADAHIFERTSETKTYAKKIPKKL